MKWNNICVLIFEKKIGVDIMILHYVQIFSNEMLWMPLQTYNMTKLQQDRKTNAFSIVVIYTRNSQTRYMQNGYGTCQHDV